jgi:hypothetical protein
MHSYRCLLCCRDAFGTGRLLLDICALLFIFSISRAPCQLSEDFKVFSQLDIMYCLINETKVPFWLSDFCLCGCIFVGAAYTVREYMI